MVIGSSGDCGKLATLCLDSVPIATEQTATPLLGEGNTFIILHSGGQN